MRIYSINSVNFLAKKPPVQNTEHQKNSAKFTKENFYNQIDCFLKEQYDEKKYLKLFADSVDKIVKQNSMSEYTPIERKYISNLISIIDMSDNYNKIPNKYLKTNMENLLKFKK